MTDLTVAGPEGAVVVDVFAPIRSDWDALPLLSPVWPEEKVG